MSTPKIIIQPMNITNATEESSGKSVVGAAGFSETNNSEAAQGFFSRIVNWIKSFFSSSEKIDRDTIEKCNDSFFQRFVNFINPFAEKKVEQLTGEGEKIGGQERGDVLAAHPCVANSSNFQSSSDELTSVSVVDLNNSNLEASSSRKNEHVTSSTSHQKSDLRQEEKRRPDPALQKQMDNGWGLVGNFLKNDDE